MASTCPACKESTLSTYELEPDLRSSQCSKCNGVWINGEQYDIWLELHGDNLPERPPEEGLSLQSGETTVAKFCPDCKYLLVKYRIGHQLGFSLNRCGCCGGIWFDKNEWQIMKSRNLHDDVHLIFSQSWQSAVLQEEHQNAMDEIWRQQFGEADLNEIRRIKTWLDGHPRTAELYAYLLQDKAEEKRLARSAAGGTVSS